MNKEGGDSPPEEEEMLPPLLDEDGFPVSDMENPSSSSIDNDDDGDNKRRKNDAKNNKLMNACNNGIREEGEEDDDSFASDFYRSGTDWSCLLIPETQNSYPRKRTKLTQTNLFQLWRLVSPISNPTQSNVDDDDDEGKKKKKKSTGRAALLPSNQNQRRPLVCPFYKKIPGTPFTVDAFRYGQVEGCSAYFLSHFHADHYGGLNKGWSHGPIYCTTLTARLVKMCLYVNPLYLRPLEFGREYTIEGIKVTMLEANHCPGAALIHFRLPSGLCYLHTGDFRASKLMQTYPTLLHHRVRVLYLDTTYCNPKYRFPAKEEVLNYIVRVTKNHLKNHPKTLVIVGAYSIGKECVYLEISKALGVKIYANASRRRILQSYGWPEISDNLCTNVRDTPLHVLPISSLRFEILEKYLLSHRSQYASVLAFRPTGWTFSETTGRNLDLIRPRIKGSVTIYGVPYSEHSSFTELQEFVEFLRPDKIIPTVNVGNAVNRDKMQSYFRQWLKA